MSTSPASIPGRQTRRESAQRRSVRLRTVPGLAAMLLQWMTILRTGGRAELEGSARKCHAAATRHQSERIGDLKLFEPITMLRLSRYATAKSAVVYGLQGGRVSASACSAGPPWGDGGPTPPRRLAPSGSAIAKSEASVVPSGGSCTNSPGRPSAHSRCSSSRRAQCPHRPTPSRKAAHRDSSASESSSARILVTDSWSFGRSRVTEVISAK